MRLYTSLVCFSRLPKSGRQSQTNSCSSHICVALLIKFNNPATTGKIFLKTISTDFALRNIHTCLPFHCLCACPLSFPLMHNVARLGIFALL